MENRVSVFTMLDELEEMVKAENPKDDLGMTYTRMYGILRAYITEEQVAEIIRLRKEYPL
jgi:hypothetical protein